MSAGDDPYEAIVVGGGFYGCCLALFLRHSHERVLVVEKEPDLLTRASYANQARVHQGYHYPRSFMTAVRSFANFPRFLAELRKCVDDSFEKVYAVARNQSNVNAAQFRKFCERLGMPIQIAPSWIRDLFEDSLIEEVFRVREVAFDAAKLREVMRRKLNEAQVPILYEACVRMIVPRNQDLIELRFEDGRRPLKAIKVFNCAYSQINMLLRNSGLPLLPLKHELTKLALVEIPDPLKRLGITIMDGPFFSLLPFPPRNLHTLSHVRYTPHESWTDADRRYGPHAYLESIEPKPNYAFMIKDAQRYVPELRKARYVESMFEIKTVLLQNEADDGRPILFRKDYGMDNLFIIMGGKIDNVYDVLEALGKLRALA